MAIAAPEQMLANAARPKRRFRYRLAGRFLREPSAVFAGVVLSIMITAAIAAPFIAPAEPNATDLRARNTPPAWQRGGSSAHPLGTDPVGRDILSRIIYGARISLTVGIVVTALATLVGVVVGLLAGYYEGWIDELVMRIADLFLAFPFILLAITIIAVLGSGLTNLILVLVVTGWVQYARLVRGLVLAIKRNQYVEAARVAGALDSRTIIRHILPNTLAPVVVLATLQIAFVLLTESALNFLGLGVDPTIPTWGSMVNEGRLYIYNAWWVITFPGIAIMLAVLSVNMLGDWLRDAFDPTLRMV